MVIRGIDEDEPSAFSDDVLATLTSSPARSLSRNLVSSNDRRFLDNRTRRRAIAVDALLLVTLAMLDSADDALPNGTGGVVLSLCTGGDA